MSNEKMEANILGTTYTIDHNFVDCYSDGECGFYDKTINIRSVHEILEGEKSSLLERGCRREEVLRHEVIHAFLFESGHGMWARDETLVDYLAIMTPKLFKIFKDLGIL